MGVGDMRLRRERPKPKARGPSSEEGQGSLVVEEAEAARESEVRE